MTTEVISYKSGQWTVSPISNLLETAEKDGIRHAWGGNTNDFQANFSWKFDWKDLKSQGVDRLIGELIIRSLSGDWHPHSIEIDWTETNQSITETLGRGYPSYEVTFEYYLIAYYAEKSPPSEKTEKPEKIDFDEMFVASDKTDVVLVVDGKKLNVNKAFLSFHSDYFSTLLSSKSEEFEDGQMKEIEIKDVSYEDFGLLLSSFYPNPQFPNDFTAEKLLEMASRFQVPSVIRIVEYHLLNNSKMGYEKMLWLADEYLMPRLLEKCVGQMNSLEKARKLKKFPEFEKLSDKTRSLIFGRLL
ncbi:hypothetical protein B9Z55_006809 [Caenorhabditis nigoni]|nr:hypothetical protein B9Z55_006809 [Caenorhabditis nigoni]